MKKFSISFFMVILFVFSLSTFAMSAEDNKCSKCHKDGKSVGEIAKKSGIQSNDELLKAIRDGKKAGIHKNLTDEDINSAGKEIFKKNNKKAPPIGC